MGESYLDIRVVLCLFTDIRVTVSFVSRTLNSLRLLGDTRCSHSINIIDYNF